jgi:very-short-patch-repair endonuclease
MNRMGSFLETDRQIAALAARQDGVVRHEQLRELGLTQRMIQRRREAGRLIDVHRMVYAVGHDRLNPTARRLAAVWAYGPKAVLSHRSAAAAWNLRAGSGNRLDVTLPARSGNEREGTRLHLTTRPLEMTTIDLLPVTTPARTILDLAGIVAPHHVEAALKQADLLELFDLAALRAVVAAHPRHPGRRTLAALLDEAARRGLTLTLSELEIHFRALCDAHRLPYPAVNARPLGFRVDFLWTDARLVVETDGWDTHKTRAAFEEDRARDQALAVAGYRTVRFTHRQVVDNPSSVAATLSALLTN